MFSVSGYLVVAIDSVLLIHFLLSSGLLRHRDAAFFKLTSGYREQPY
jgi:hypothetical protein